MGAYHTLDLELNRKFTLGKQEWDTIALERIGNLLVVVFINSYCNIVTLHVGDVNVSIDLPQIRLATLHSMPTLLQS